MDRTFTADRPGPVALTLTATSARVRVVVDPRADRARVTVTTAADSGPASAAVQRATARTLPDRFDVTVPDTAAGPAAGGIFVNGTVGGVTITNGRVITGTTAGADHRITAEVTLPPGSAAKIRTVSGDIETTGFLAALAVRSISGRVDAAAVRDVLINNTSGDVRIGHIDRGQARIRTISGTITIDAYGGTSAELSAVSGTIVLTAVPAAAGVVDAKTVSGSVDFRDARHLDVRAGSVSGSTRVR